MTHGNKASRRKEATERVSKRTGEIAECLRKEREAARERDARIKRSPIARAFLRLRDSVAV